MMGRTTTNKSVQQLLIHDLLLLCYYCIVVIVFVSPPADTAAPTTASSSLSLSFCCDNFSCSRRRRRRRRRRQRIGGRSHNYEGARRGQAVAMAASTDSFVLPIFPLRKTVRLPNDPLTLNLYEDRYLAMARYILGEEEEETKTTTTTTNPSKTATKYFGAMYCSNKPQIVTDGGIGPIVPMVEKGDVGVLFIVDHTEEGMIPTVGGKDPRYRIRLVGKGVARFEIDKILHNGYGGGEDYTTTGEGTSSVTTQHQQQKSSYPFILVEAHLRTDKPLLLPSEKDKFVELRDKLQLLKLNNNNNSPSSSSPLDSSVTDDDDELMNDAIISSIEIPINVKIDSTETMAIATNEEELTSFAFASEHVDDGMVEERLDLLNQDNSLSRLEAVRDLII